MPDFQPHGTTIICVRRDGRVAICGDGQVTLGTTIMKSNARKVRKLFNGSVLAGFAGATADAFTLIEKFEAKIEEYGGNLQRASVELAKEWRTNKMLRQLEALLIVADIGHTFIISGTGDVIEPEDGIAAIGSGGPYALAAARAMLLHSQLPARDVALESLSIAAGICIYTNSNTVLEEL